MGSLDDKLPQGYIFEKNGQRFLLTGMNGSKEQYLKEKGLVGHEIRTNLDYLSVDLHYHILESMQDMHDPLGAALNSMYGTNTPQYRKIIGEIPMAVIYPIHQ